MIPAFPEFAPLTLDYRQQVEAVLARVQPRASEYTFTNLYAWRTAAEYAIARLDTGYLVRKTVDGVHTFLQPLVTDDEAGAVRLCADYLRGLGMPVHLERVGEDFLARAGVPAGITATEERDQFDYVYDVEELIALQGEKFHDKKNLVHQFERKYDYRYVPLTVAMAPAAITFAHEWCEDRRCRESQSLLHEHCAVYQMLSHLADLGAVVGGALLVEEQMVAFTLGEPLNAETYVIHVEKAHTGMTGVYQVMHREYLRHAVRGFAYVNREQDLGVPGLRKAKTSYNPVRMVKKYRLDAE